VDALIDKLGKAIARHGVAEIVNHADVFAAAFVRAFAQELDPTPAARDALKRLPLVGHSLADALDALTRKDR